jgi:iron transport multicopper oxidase
MQYTDGISGPLIVHPTAPSPPEFSTWDEEIVIQMADWYHEMSEVLLAQYFAVRLRAVRL